MPEDIGRTAAFCHFATGKDATRRGFARIGYSSTGPDRARLVNRRKRVKAPFLPLSRSDLQVARARISSGDSKRSSSSPGEQRAVCCPPPAGGGERKTPPCPRRHPWRSAKQIGSTAPEAANSADPALVSAASASGSEPPAVTAARAAPAPSAAVKAHCRPGETQGR
jgi:hypothetical protein